MALRHDPLPRVVQHILTKPERVIESERRHWAWLAEPVGTLLLGTLFALWISVNVPDGGEFLTLLWLAWLVLVGRTGWMWFLWWRQCFVVTSDRFILVHGGITLTVSQLPLEYGKDITLRQNLPGQWLGFGDFVLERAPKENALRHVTWLPDCERLHRRISRLLQGDDGKSRYVESIVPTLDDDTIVIIDETSRSTREKVKAERVHRRAGEVVTPVQSPGVLSLWRGIRSTMPGLSTPPAPVRRPRLRRRPWRSEPAEPERKNITTTGKEPQHASIFRKL